MGAFSEKMEIHVAEDRFEGVGVFRFLYRSGPRNPKNVFRAARQGADEQAGLLDGLQGAQRAAAATGKHVHAEGAWNKDAHHPAMRGVVRPQIRKRVGETSRLQCLRRRAIVSDGDIVHAPNSSARAMRSARPRSGMSTQSGLLVLS